MVFPERVIQPVEAGGEHFSGLYGAFFSAFPDPHSPKDQVASFVLKTNSSGISTFDIQIYTV